MSELIVLKEVTVLSTNINQETAPYGYFLNIIIDTIDETLLPMLQSDRKVVNQQEVVNFSMNYKLPSDKLQIPHNLRSGDVVSLVLKPLLVGSKVYHKPLLIKFNYTQSFGIKLENTGNDKINELFRLIHEEEK